MTDNIATSLDSSQYQAVTAPDGPLLVVAGPGSGKTRVLTTRVVTMVERGVEPWRILAVTFTNKAADEMRERLATMVPADVARQMWVCTVHAACVRILRAEHLEVGIPRNFSIADSGDTERLLRTVATDLGVVNTPTDARAYARIARSTISSARNRRKPIMGAGVRAGIERLADVEAEYRRHLRASGMLDFDDLLVLTHQLVTSGSDTALRWADRWKFVAQDEAQDANVIQSELIAALASAHRNVTYVGDYDQSIYGFRGANPDTLADFGERWPEGNVVALDRNYRSTPAIVEAAGAIIAANPAVHRATQSTSADSGHPVLARQCLTDRDEAAWVVGMISQLPYPKSERAVLVRTNVQTRVIEEALLAARMPYRLIGDVRFYDRAEVRDVLAWLRVATNPHDALAFDRAAAAPRRGIGPAALTAVHAASGDGNLVEGARRVAEQGGRGATALAGFVADVDAVVSACGSDGPTAAVRAVLATGLADQWAKDPSGTSRTENLAELAEAVGEFCQSGVDAQGNPVAAMSPLAATEAFLEHAALVASADTDAVDAVPVMTVHASKGREFDAVFVVGVEEGILPHVLSVDDPSQVAEERRLLFVAMTRARHRLFVSWARERFRFNKREKVLPSRFLADLPDTVVRSGKPPATPQLPSWGAGVQRSRPAAGASRRPQPSRKSASSNRRRGTGGTAGLTAPSRRSPVATGPRLGKDEAVTGARVTHGVFGPGEIVNVSGNIVKVVFADGTTRTLDRTMAPLEVVRRAS